MANLNGQNIGTNYKGILNLNTLNGNLSGTLQAVTDGDGNTSPLQLSTTQVRIDSGIVNRRLTFGSNGQMTFVNDNDYVIDYTTGSANIFRLAYSGSFVKFNSDGYQFANYAAGTIYANLQSVGLAIGQGSTIASARLHVLGDGTNPIALFAGSGTIGNLVCFGGTTNAFPALKRNGAEIDFRLADDSGLCNINVNKLGYGGNSESIAGSNNSGFTDFRSNQGWQFTDASGGTVYNRITSAGISFGDNTLVATAQVAINSTTKGFLPPRMTTVQVNAITTPATGLVLYDTTLNKLAVYTGSAWETVTSI